MLGKDGEIPYLAGERRLFYAKKAYFNYDEKKNRHCFFRGVYKYINLCGTQKGFFLKTFSMAEKTNRRNGYLILRHSCFDGRNLDATNELSSYDDIYKKAEIRIHLAFKNLRCLIDAW